MMTMDSFFWRSEFLKIESARVALVVGVGVRSLGLIQVPGVGMLSSRCGIISDYFPMTELNLDNSFDLPDLFSSVIPA